MREWLSNFWQALTWTEILVGATIMVVTFVLSYVAVSIVMIKIPANYFHSDYEHHFFSDSHPLLRAVAITVKNIFGVVLIITGIILSLPGMPGPGLLTIFIGLMLTDLPGKRVLEAKIIKRPSILAAVNNLRRRYGKPELVMD
jgi:hypothetical protein